MQILKKQNMLEEHKQEHNAQKSKQTNTIGKTKPNHARKSNK
jgi:hypothetical protein